MKKSNKILLIVFAVMLMTGSKILPLIFAERGNIALTNEKIKSKFEAKLNISAQNTQEIIKLLINNHQITFKNILDIAVLPTYIYINNNLTYWNDIKSYIPPSVIYANREYELINTKFGKFVACHTIFYNQKNKIDIVQLIRLTTRYAIENKYLKSSYNADILPDNISTIHADSKSGHKFGAPDGKYIFSIEYKTTAHETYNTVLHWARAFIFFMGIVLMAFVIFHSKVPFYEEYKISTIILLGKILFVIFNFPDAFIKSKLFNAQYFNHTYLGHSLGYFTINIVLICVILYEVAYKYKSANALVIRINKLHDRLLTCIVFIWHIILCIIVYAGIYILFHNTYTSVAYYQIFDFSYLKIFGFICLAGITLFYVLSNHTWVVLYSLISKRQHRWACVFLSLLSSFIISVYIDKGLGTVCILSLIYSVFLYYFRLYKNFLKFNYQSYLYLFTHILMASVMVSISEYNHYHIEYREYINSIAAEIIHQNTTLFENEIDTTKIRIESDHYIQYAIQNPYVPVRNIANKIQKHYLKTYRDKYDITVYVFDHKGYNILQNNDYNYQSLMAEIGYSYYVTPRRGVYATKNKNSTIFICDIKKNNHKIGSILVQLTAKPTVSYSILPELLVDNTKRRMQTGEYSYAIFAGNKTTTSYGKYNYEANLNRLLRLISYRSFDMDAHHHHTFVLPDSRYLLLSYPMYNLYQISTAFSWYFLLFSGILLIFILIHVIYVSQVVGQTAFTTKIQLFLNFSFFIPLLAVVLATFVFVNNNYNDELRNATLQKAYIFSLNLYETMQDKPDEALLRKNIVSAGQLLQSDIWIYNLTGKLIASTHTKIFEYNFQNLLINPVAYSALNDKNEKNIILEEKIGNFSYHTVYGKVPSAGLYFCMPYFDINKVFQQRFLQILSILINIFALLFIIFIIASYFSARYLTLPITLLIKRLKKTTLFIENKPLVYNRNDEIAILVREYNTMLEKIEKNKMQLALNEKEMAWKEMAKQVAHEIKNPLTPIKLSIQNIQRQLATSKYDIKQIATDALPAILHQIDIITQITDSFNTLARLPTPNMQVVNIVPVINHTIALARNSMHHSIDFINNTDNVHIYGDALLLERVLMNLYINAIQSIPPEREPVISISMHVYEEELHLSVSDNGIGIIGADIDKVFYPNFSTKSTGSGLGLYVSKNAVELLGGKLNVNSTQGIGTTFTITLPLYKQ
ncbi:MAG: HAMP domain-containing sensor histidine kinase [Cytophagales bacterium]|nr:HAMP domain-containing sensor histidine kinase [Cytophagales bacterium]